MKNDITIEQYGSEKYEQVVKYLYKIDKIFPDPMSSRVNIEEHMVKLFSRGVVIVALKSDEICGILLGYINDLELRRAYLATLGVSTQVQSMGVGTKLLTTFVDMATKQNMDYIGLHAHRENLRAIKFYEKHGFAQTQDMQKPYEKSLYFTKKIR
jgi:ribosomal protein S18 acetylase RimI-like enzyme